MYKVAVLISGSGSNMEAVIKESLKTDSSYKVVLVASDRVAKGTEKAENLGVKNVITLDRKSVDFKNRLIEEIKESEAEIIVLAGYLSILPGEITGNFKGRIINIHPSLLPKYGGRGMYGIKVHEKVIENGEKVSGCTCHLVNDVVDGGEILIQKKVDVKETDSPEDLQKRILPIEHIAIVEGLKELVKRMGE